MKKKLFCYISRKEVSTKERNNMLWSIFHNHLAKHNYAVENERYYVAQNLISNYNLFLFNNNLYSL